MERDVDEAGTAAKTSTSAVVSSGDGKRGGGGREKNGRRGGRRRHFRSTGVQEDPERFVRAVLTAFQDGTADLFKTTARVDLTLSLLLVACASALLAACWKTTATTACRDRRSSTNAYGDEDRPCRAKRPTERGEDVECYRRVDGTTGRTLYLRNLSGIHFEMTAPCSSNAPENEHLKCRKEWSVVESSLRLAWFFRLYENVSTDRFAGTAKRGETQARDETGRYSLVSTATILRSTPWNRPYERVERKKNVERESFQNGLNDKEEEGERHEEEKEEVEEEEDDDDDDDDDEGELAGDVLESATPTSATFRVVFGPDRANWIVSSDALPRDLHPDADVFFDVPVTFDRVKVDDQNG